MATELIEEPLSVAKAFSPGHITGFFEVPDDTCCFNPLHRGSKGAGFSIDRGIATTAYLYESTKPEYQIWFNGIKSRNAEVSKWVIEKYLACNTGLGTVIAEFAGGFEMRTMVGAPGIGSVSKINLDENYKAVILCLAPILTKSFLTNRINEINGLGGIMLAKLSASKSVDDFLKMSRRFAEMLGLTDGKCTRPIATLKTRGIESSVALFGQTVFTIVSHARADEAAAALREFGGTLIVCSIDRAGARVL
jgi:pantoate kinase